MQSQPMDVYLTDKKLLVLEWREWLPWALFMIRNEGLKLNNFSNFLPKKAVHSPMAAILPIGEQLWSCDSKDHNPE